MNGAHTNKWTVSWCDKTGNNKNFAPYLELPLKLSAPHLAAPWTSEAACLKHPSPGAELLLLTSPAEVCMAAKILKGTGTFKKTNI